MGLTLASKTGRELSLAGLLLSIARGTISVFNRGDLAHLDRMRQLAVPGKQPARLNVCGQLANPIARN
jgi:hypothetical protein